MKQEKNVSVMNKGNEMYWTQSVLSAADMLKPHIAFYNDSTSHITMWWPGSNAENGDAFAIPEKFKRPS
jgi:hypothetical protein